MSAHAGVGILCAECVVLILMLHSSVAFDHKLFRRFNTQVLVLCAAYRCEGALLETHCCYALIMISSREYVGGMSVGKMEVSEAIFCSMISNWERWCEGRRYEVVGR